MKLIKSFWRTIFWSFVVFFLSAVSGNVVDEVPIMHIPGMDKIGHIGMYFVFTFLLVYDFRRYKNYILSRRQVIFYSLLVPITFGALMEIVQLMPSLQRSSDIFDFIADSIGAVLAVLLFNPLNFILTKIGMLFTKPKQNYSV